MRTAFAALGFGIFLQASMLANPLPVRSATAEIPGTAADARLQQDVSGMLFDQANVLHKGCAPRVVRVEPYRDDEPSVILADRGGKLKGQEKKLRARGLMAVERWFVQSCDAVDRYEVLIIVGESGADFSVRNLDPSAWANIQAAPPDSASELERLVRDAGRGDAEAQFDLALRYFNGDGVSKSSDTAAVWYRMAADQGNEHAQYNLGALYFLGDGVTQSDSAAAFWFRKAAEQGAADAEFNMGTLYQSGRGVPRDIAAAMQW